ncbi:NAD(P)H-binding protein [Salipaludibacillus daqingensis]|uniref:NAD(P)H-binding protein n=1 Tax=Salipaludibacillus daqingensis TaxID=3041001 RepID=UPI0024742436|nr:NAD(P)H-binding protein [Salipaludibacillus daqingensis]
MEESPYDVQKDSKPKIVIAGASGYIGRNIINELTGADIVALSRNASKQKESSEKVTWRSCDLFSMVEIEECLEGADYAVYLVHSMLSSARLTQGTFEDMDLILADNFAQAARKKGVKQIVYLGGLIPDTEDLSRHLKSRLEVEKVLSSYSVPVTTLRAGLIVGPQGSSFPILIKLVRRLPVMLLPKWTNTLTHPIALIDVLTGLKESIGNKDVYGKTIDIGGPEVMTYKEMMIRTAKSLDKERYLVNIPYFTPQLSRLWVSLTTNTPKNLVYPLIESLIHPMTAQRERMVEGISYGKTPFLEAAKDAIDFEEKHTKVKLSHKNNRSSSVTEDTVRSVQRLPLPAGKNAKWVALYYVKWLAKLLKPIIKVKIDENYHCQLNLIFLKEPLMEFSYSKDRSTPERALFYISGGKLADTEKNPRGRLEFRQIPETNECLAAIHDYTPSLPWFIYVFTQAYVHLWVMNRFKKNLSQYSFPDENKMG